MTISDVTRSEDSEICHFYDGKNIFITGASGFLGKILMEKLLRCCSGVGTVYLLMRQKRGKDVHERLYETFDDPLFSQLKEEVPKFMHKVVLVPGDCYSPGLGISSADREMLIEKVNIIFHCAATVNFNEDIRTAFKINVDAPLAMLELAKSMKGLQVFMHVSTAYSHCHLTMIEEKLYPFPFEYHELSDRLASLSDEESAAITPNLIKPWPNTYTFTKALAENTLRANAEHIPLAIFRPAIVGSTADGPIKGWVDNMNGPTGIIAGSVTGVLHVLNCNSANNAEVVPVDYVVNCLMAAAPNVYNYYGQSIKPTNPPIFNYVTSTDNLIKWGEFMQIMYDSVPKYPISRSMWYTSLYLVSSNVVYNTSVLFLHLIPATILDLVTAVTTLSGKPKMINLYKKVHILSSALKYFCNHRVDYCNKYVTKLWQNTNEVDKKLFPFDMAHLDWTTYLDNYLKGVRRYVFKETDDTYQQAKTKMTRLYYLHQLLKWISFSTPLYFIWKMLLSYRNRSRHMILHA